MKQSGDALCYVPGLRPPPLPSQGASPDCFDEPVGLLAPQNRRRSGTVATPGLTRDLEFLGLHITLNRNPERHVPANNA
ncbi:MAG: hypothetical protein CO105_07345 [Comamonadaceae bacterium CG_4_9_14_3_um_filter_60_33]|nr:MAG: hypothetical protein COZ09_15060 [Comamonadaceae bacterium CG_4_10_14_3_um_filter_60_42]PJB44016.1 MAG: hypothetical protein CO105_07345 [Comamonadaceae bacterium CG_4_9_14_3_um_filter_60_33]